LGVEDDDVFYTMFEKGMLAENDFPFKKGLLVNDLSVSSDIIGSLRTVEGITVNTVHGNDDSPGQIVISGSFKGIDEAVVKLSEAGAKRALKLPVGGAFHSPLMEPAKKELEEAINNTSIQKPICPIYQNVNALPETEPEKIRINLISQLTSPVRWTQTVVNMMNNGASSFTEVGPGKVLQGLIKKVDRKMPTESA